MDSLSDDDLRRIDLRLRTTYGLLREDSVDLVYGALRLAMGDVASLLAEVRQRSPDGTYAHRAMASGHSDTV